MAEEGGDSWSIFCFVLFGLVCYMGWGGGGEGGFINWVGQLMNTPNYN